MASYDRRTVTQERHGHHLRALPYVRMPWTFPQPSLRSARSPAVFARHAVVRQHDKTRAVCYRVGDGSDSAQSRRHADNRARRK